ncbi:hypothetical protein AW736_07800 [Termitidicoccus mucosus]|uniref:DUF4038 domain-containing protein n=2 Tax=Termitidicoccus mucosus TaxID=1184151 RepID=A0A178IMP7_9BACT|nr:hypothetical protein AW736_07800 [Opitutaceae bacterium TSB47]
MPHLRVSEDGTHLVHADGTPFFWLGDTAWELFHRLDRDDAVMYLDCRAEQQFTVIQAVLLAESNGLRTPNAYGELPLHDLAPARPNVRYFEHVDFIVAEAGRRGLVVAMLPTWADKVPSNTPGAGPVVFTPENAFAYGRFLGARYRHASIIWMLGGDRGIDSPAALEIWRAMARGLREGDGGAHLMTFHPKGGASSAQCASDEPWLDFHVYQSGHAARWLPVYRFALELAALRPRKPFLDAEPPYEDIPIKFWEHVKLHSSEPVPAGVLDERGLIAEPGFFADGFYTDHDARVHAYWNMLSGACGHTYGNNAVWQMHEHGARAAIPCLHDWREAIDRPGAWQMRHLRALLTARPFHLLAPAQDMIHGLNPEGRDHVRAVLAHTREFALAYVTCGRPLTLAMGAVSGEKVRAWWFDPRTGEGTVATDVSNNGIQQFAPPTGGADRDWVLVLDAI